MNFDQFITKYLGKFVEYHSYSAGAENQCVDLANQWLDEGLGLQAIIGTNAIDFPSKAVARGMIWIPNTPDGIPQPGDLIVYEGTVGHIDIALEGCTTSKIVAFSQNYPTNSPCVVRTGTYLRPKVVGWLHPKENMATMYKGLDLTNQDSMKVAVDVWDEVINQKLYVKVDDYKKLLESIPATDVENAKAVLGGIRGRITELENKLGTAQANEKIMSDQVSGLINKVTTIEEKLKMAEDHAKQHEISEQQILRDKADLLTKMSILQNQYDTLKQAQTQGEVTITLKELFWLLWNQKIIIKKG